MKVLVVILSPVDNLNSATMRTVGVIKGLVRLGHEVTVLNLPGAGGTIQTDYSRDPDMCRVKIVNASGSQVREKIWTDPKEQSLKAKAVNVLRTVYHKLSILGSSAGIAKRLVKSILGEDYYDVVISSSDPKTSHMAVESLRRSGLRFGKWLQYWGDPLAQDITGSSIYPRWYLKRVERKLFYQADAIVYVSPFTLAQQKKAYPGFADKMSAAVIPYMQEKIYPAHPGQKYHVSYIGDYPSHVRNILPLYDAMKAMDGQIEADIIGATDLELESTANITISPRGKADAIEAKSDLLVCILNSRGSQIPGKIYHYAATNLPILVVTDGENAAEISDYLARFDRYVLCENQTAAIVQAIHTLRAEAPAAAPCPQFRPETVAQALLDKLK